MRFVKPITYILSISGIIICAGIGFKLWRDGKSLTEVLSVVSAVASLFGLPIAIVQIRSVKQISEATQRAIEETKAHLILSLSISDLSKAIKLTEQIQVYLGHGKHEMAHTRLQELRAILVHFRGDPAFVDESNKKDYESLLRTIGIHIINLYDAVYMGKVIRIEVINRTLEAAITIMVAYEHKLKIHGGKNDFQARKAN